MKHGIKGFNPQINEPDIAYGFKTSMRADKFGIDMSDIDAHTLKIVEIIEEEKQNVKQKRIQELQRQIDQ